MKCFELWGTDCELDLSEDNNFHCKILNHCNGRNSAVIRASLEDGFQPDDITLFSSHNSADEPSDELISFVRQQVGGLQFLAESRHTPTSLLSELAAHSNKNVLLAIASNFNTNAATLDILASSSDQEIRVAVSRNPRCNPDTLFELSFEPSYAIKRALAENESTPHDLLQQYTTDENSLRNHLIKNIALSPGLIETISHDKNIDVRILCAQHQNISAATLNALAHDEDWRVRYAVAQSPQTNVQLLDLLASDIKASVRSSVAINSETPHNLLESLIYDPDYVIRYRMAQNPGLPLDLFARLLSDENATVRRILTTNSQTPFFYDRNQMENLTKLESPYAWSALLSNLEAPETLKSHIRANADKQVGVAINRFAKSNIKNVFLIADIVSTGAADSTSDAKFDLLSYLCRNPDDPDRIDSLAGHIVTSAKSKLTARHMIRDILLRDFTGASAVAHAILRNYQVA